MKTCPCRIPPKTQIPRLAPATPTGIDTVQAVRNSFATFKLLFILCITAVTTAAFADDLTFTNVNGANIGLTASWTNLAGANAVPNGNNNDNVIWSGVTPGNLLLNFDSPG